MESNILYKILATVDEVNTISEVAEKVYLSQPYVSQIILRAERKYNVVLVNRNTKPISLTIAGHKLLTDLELKIDIENQIKHDMNILSNQSEEQIRIAITPIWIPSLTNKVIKTIQQDFPNIHFEIKRYFTASESLQQLKNNNIDIFWGALSHQKEIKAHYLYRSHASIIIPYNHPLYQPEKTEITYTPEIFAQLNNSNYVALTDDSLYQNIVDHVFEDDGLKIQKVIKTNDFIGASLLAIDGLGITITLSDVLQYLNYQSNFNIMNLPESLINLDVGLNTNIKCSKIIENVTKHLIKIIKG